MAHLLSGIACAFFLYVAVVSSQNFPTVGSNSTVSFKPTQGERDGIVLTHDLDTNWEEFLIPAPTVVCLLGSLTVISGKTDFALNAPQNGFKHINHPESFRATLVQVANDGWDAFRIAQRNMDTVQLTMRGIPVEVATVENHISEAPVEVLEGLLEIRLNNIKSSGEQCARLAEETEKKFVDVMLLMNEITESTTSTEGTYNADLRAAQAEINASRILQKVQEQQAAALAKREIDINKQVDQYRTEYKKAMDAIPTGWSLIGQQFVQGLSDAATGFVNTYLNPTSIFKSSKRSGSSTGGQDLGKVVKQAVAKTASLALATPLSQMFEAIKGAVEAGKAREEFKPFLTLLSAFKRSTSDTSKEASGIFQLIGSAEELINKIVAPAPAAGNTSSNGTDGQVQFGPEILKQVNGLIQSVKPLVAEAAGVGDDPDAGRPQASSTGELDAVREGSDNAKFAAAQRAEMLKEKERQYDQLLADMHTQQEKMANLMGRMATLDMETVNFKDILKLITEGMKHIATIREQWSHLIQFFSGITVRAQLTMKQVDTFTKGALLAQGLSEASRRYMLKSEIRPTAIEIQKSAYFLYTLSKTYVDVSNRYIITQLAGMARLTVLPPNEQTEALKKLSQESIGASTEIRRMAAAKKEEYKRLLGVRLTSELNFVEKLGGVTETDKADIKKGLDAAKKVVAVDGEDDFFG